VRDQLFNSGGDTLLLGILLLVVLFVGFFRLDELVFRSKKKQLRKRPATATVRKTAVIVYEEDDYLKKS
jgi:hypothetical protein